VEGGAGAGCYTVYGRFTLSPARLLSITTTAGDGATRECGPLTRKRPQREPSLSAKAGFAKGEAGAESPPFSREGAAVAYVVNRCVCQALGRIPSLEKGGLEAPNLRPSAKADKRRIPAPRRAIFRWRAFARGGKFGLGRKGGFRRRARKRRIPSPPPRHPPLKLLAGDARFAPDIGADGEIENRANRRANGWDSDDEELLSLITRKVKDVRKRRANGVARLTKKWKFSRLQRPDAELLT